MFESDADRLSMLAGLGGTAVAGPRGQFTGLLETPYASVGDGALDDSAPVLFARKSDVERYGVGPGVALRVGDEVYTVRSVRPDGDGMVALGLEGP